MRGLVPVGHGPVEEGVHGVDVRVQVLRRLHDVVNVPEEIEIDELIGMELPYSSVSLFLKCYKIHEICYKTQ